MIEVAKKLPEIKFKFFGNPAQVGTDPALPKNIEYAGYVNDMDAFISECSAIMRFPIHDGLPLSVLEFILAGRYSLQNVPIKHTTCIPQLDVELIIETLKKLKEHTEKVGLNQEGSDYWRKELDYDKFKKTIIDLATYNPKEYWENRARSWSEQAGKMTIEIEDVKKVFDEVKPKSVLDIGCGDGRWYPHLKEWGIEDYTGIDISENLIKAMELRFPHLKGNLFATKVEDYNSDKKVDLVFSYTCCEHITAEEWPKALKALKKMGKQLLLIEPVNFQSRYYCHSHDYKNDFKVIKEVKLKDKVILLCDLESQS